MSCKKTQTVNATITDIVNDKATIRLDTPEQKSCQHCQTQGGCRSVSLYQLLFANRPIYIDNKDYSIGQQLTLQFPDNLILNTVGLLLGLPLIAFVIGVVIATPIHELAGFALGISLATIGIGLGKKFLHQKLSQQLLIVT